MRVRSLLFALLCAACRGTDATPPPIAATPPATTQPPTASAAPMPNASNAPNAAPTAATRPAPVFSQRPTMAQAKQRFDSAGVQPGQALPALRLRGLDGQPADLRRLADGKPMVLVTCSLTCNVARRQQVAVAELQRTLGAAATVVMVYTLEAHPNGDACPYTGEEWVPPANADDGVLVRQPTTMDERLQLARRYASDWARDVPVLVDELGDAAWLALGQAPNVGLCIDRAGVVTARCGWFDAQRLQQAARDAAR